MRRTTTRILDEYLVAAAQAGSREAFAQLTARWTPRLLRFAARTIGDADSAADIVQDTWASVIAMLPRLGDPARFPAWIYAIARRRSIDALRKTIRRRAVMAEAAGETETNLDPTAASDAHLDVARGLARLPPDQRVALSLFYTEDLSIEEIAAATGAPVGTVKSRLHAAKASLRALMKETSDDPT